MRDKPIEVMHNKQMQIVQAPKSGSRISDVESESFERSLKQESEIVSTDEGTQTARNDEPYANGHPPTFEARLPDSHAKVERLCQ
jgi:hypothetical protein